MSNAEPPFVADTYILCEVVEPDPQDDEPARLSPRVVNPHVVMPDAHGFTSRTFEDIDKAIGYASANRILGSAGGRLMVVRLEPVAYVHAAPPMVARIPPRRFAPPQPLDGTKEGA